MPKIATQHEYLDTYRLCNGVLLNVKKYEILNSLAWSAFQYNKNSFKKISGLKNLYIAIKSVNRYHSNEILFNVGDIFYDGCKIKKIDNPEKYRYELKTTGESFSGDLDVFSNYLKDVQDILGKYII